LIKTQEDERPDRRPMPSLEAEEFVPITAAPIAAMAPREVPGPVAAGTCVSPTGRKWSVPSAADISGIERPPTDRAAFR
jgi:hypothetical protein